MNGRKVADFVEIPVSDQDGFASGDPARAIWHWLERREALGKLSDALRYVRRDDLIVLPEPEVPAVQSGGPTLGGCPYPGLLSFKPSEAPIFFGRTQETAQLLERLHQPDNRFLAVVGASGSGKSSLVKAGVIPQIEAKGGWLWTRLIPGEVDDDPFLALATALKPLLQEQYDSVRQIHVRLAETGDIGNLVRAALANQAATELLVFIDQFEELFTLAAEAHRLPFTILLDRMASMPGLRTLITLRADFYQRCLDYPHLTALLRQAQTSFPLHTPDMPALYEMITGGPAGVAGLCFDNGLVSHILRDTGSAPGAVALMAFALNELYRASAPNTRLTLAAYEGFGGVQGAIGKRADTVFDDLAEGAQQAFDSVFTELVDVDAERGIPARKRGLLAHFEPSEAARRLIAAFVDARLFVCDDPDQATAVVEVAHEALLTYWPRLQKWIEARFDDFRLLRQLRQEAAEWGRLGRPKSHLWPHERLQSVYTMRERLGPTLTGLEQDFIRAEAERLLGELADPATSHERRATIGDRLAEIGDPRPGVGVDAQGLPRFVWLPVPEGTVTLEGDAGTFRVEPFFISQYPVTWVPYRSFLEADDGYYERWWTERELREQFHRKDNYPADNVFSWYGAMAYCRWLSNRLGYDIRLPTEWEWQWAATGGDPSREYPRPGDWDPARANTYESGLSRTTAVGMYPVGASPVGARHGEKCLRVVPGARPTRKCAPVRRCPPGGARWLLGQLSGLRARRLPQPQRSRLPWHHCGVACGVFVPHWVNHWALIAA
jgi:conflict system STAND superfamily ATPase/sulfatase-modifying factor enzyme 1/bDLD-like protein